MSLSHDYESENFTWLSGGDSIALINQNNCSYRIFNNFWKGSETGAIRSVVYSDLTQNFFGLIKREDGSFYIHKMSSSLDGVVKPEDGTSTNRSAHPNVAEVVSCSSIWKSGKF